MKIKNKFKYIMLIIVLSFLFSPIPLAAQVDDLDADEVETFLDGVISAQINQNKVPGAVISVVNEGELIFSKGYGYSDLEEGIPVNPEDTLFRPGSISKLFTWTAVMQLVEEGKLDLDEDINSYLNFTIPGDQPITLRNIMTHTSGFEDIGEGLFFLSEEEMLTLEEFLKTYQPARVFPPGEIMAYSNYATGLAGHIVELVSEMDFADYVNENIFQPLAMDNSTFSQPLPEDLGEDLAGAYKYAGGQYHQGDFEYIPNNAAGAMSTTAEDMANFMLAHLQLGSFGDNQILKEETALEMQNHHFTHHPEIEGMALGFAREKINGEQVISHTGATILFYSGLYLLPEHDLGLFVSYSGGSPLQMSKLFNSFMDRYFPGDLIGQSEASQVENSMDKELLAGEYHPTRSNFTGLEKIQGLLQRAGVEVTDDGFLRLNIYGDSLQLKEIEPGLYQNRNYHGGQIIDKVAFIDDEEQGFLLATGGPGVFQKVDWYESSMLLGALTVLILILSIWTVISGLRKFIIQKIFRQKLSSVDRRGITGIFMVLTGLSIIIFFAGVLIIFGSINPAYGLPDIVFSDYGTFEEIVFMLPYLITGLIVLVFIFTLRSWWKRNHSLYRRLTYSFYTLAGLGFIWVMYYLNFI
ncbi:MAG: serine hydrolase domain-containing protein [Bacillota bacterium]